MVRVLPSGSQGLLLELDSLQEVLDLYAALVDEDLPVLDLVPAGRTILLVADRGVDLAALATRVARVEPGSHGRRAPAPVEVPVRYDGEDLADAADLLGLPVEEVVRRHREEEWTVAFCGFAPGFAYLAGERFRWDLPRRTTPRTRVPARALALAGEFTGCLLYTSDAADE